jgi:hypothetical protein
VGSIPAPSALPLPSTFTQNSIPTSADAVETVVLIFVLVKRPVTALGVIFNVTPFPFEVEMSASQMVISVPPLKVPSPPIIHVAEVADALKFPLLCAYTRLPRPKRIANTKGTLKIVIFFILLLLINTNALSSLSLRGVERRSNPMKNEIATPFGLAMTICGVKIFTAFV